MTVRCVIIDDEPLATELIERHVAQLGGGLQVVATFNTAVKAFEFLKTNPVDLLFLDIQMPQLSGIDFLKSANIVPKVIFTTAYREYALEGYELNVIDYLLKPITFERFLEAVGKYFDRVSFQPQQTLQASASVFEKDHIYVKTNRKHVKVNFVDILYIESIKDYIKLQTTERSILVKEKISGFETLLPKQLFIRTHRSYIVNTKWVTAFTNHDVEIGAIEIPIGSMYKNQVLNKLC